MTQSTVLNSKHPKFAEPVPKKRKRESMPRGQEEHLSAWTLRLLAISRSFPPQARELLPGIHIALRGASAICGALRELRHGATSPREFWTESRGTLQRVRMRELLLIVDDPLSWKAFCR